MNLPLQHLSVIRGAVVESILGENAEALLPIVREAYLAHADGCAANPPSQFLRFKDDPATRVISLPASLDYGNAVSGVKWIGSYPGNVDRGLPRASAVLILNRRDNGYPFAILEGSAVSAVRTAASAALAAQYLVRPTQKKITVGIVGAGVIARRTLELLHRLGRNVERVIVHDSDPKHAHAFIGNIARLEIAEVHSATLPDLAQRSDLIVFATTAATPHVHDATLFAHNPTILHLSLRDLAPAIVRDAFNVVDDIDHCLTARTSLHLAEMELGERSFVSGTIAQLLRGELTVPWNRPRILSPFGMGILDLAVGRYVYERAVAQGEHAVVENFFG